MASEPYNKSAPAKPRRPDRAVYVPRALRAEHPPEPKPPDARKAVQPPENTTKCPKSPVPREKSQPTTPRKTLDKSFCNVYTPPHLRNQRSQVVSPTEQQTQQLKHSSDPVPSDFSVPNSISAIPYYSDYSNTDIGVNFYIGDYYTNGQLGLYTPNAYYNYDNHIANESSEFDNRLADYNTSFSPVGLEWTNESTDVSMELQDPSKSSDIIDVNYSLQYVEKDEDAEKRELIRASQEINRSSKRIIKQSFDSDVLVISDPLVDPKNEPEAVPEEAIPETVKPKVKLEAKVSLKREENDWDAVFDDSGECLDPSLLEELTATVGKVQISKPKNNYGQYQTKAQTLFNGPYDETFAHVIEVYDFPNEFKTNDLLSVFSEYKDTGFEIKWVDDTHALIVFSSAKIGQSKNIRWRAWVISGYCRLAGGCVHSTFPMLTSSADSPT
ncbi:Coiled-coil domain-containing protein R3HCC1L [Eumeta japonica]|uniref:Coiled-coil domain-containing protein R3HCC1L n=1 Tax=Eumeta variegata TaxID=151549 RepID=A0A4C1Z6W6_EUMVA|nr:Coiled-coil domain-containing protein R3HCC1L [Eumeta japonica]